MYEQEPDRLDDLVNIVAGLSVAVELEGKLSQVSMDHALAMVRTAYGNLRTVEAYCRERPESSVVPLLERCRQRVVLLNMLIDRMNFCFDWEELLQLREVFVGVVRCHVPVGLS